MKLKGKVAIITGSSRGLGKAFALRFSQEGARVVVADILDTAGAVQEIEEKGGEVLPLHTDVSDEESTLEMTRKTIERFGSADILVNNAAVFATLGKKGFSDISGEEWDRVMGVNLKGVFLCCKAVHPQMKKQGKGKIINLSSSTFFSGTPNFLHYVTTKGGVVAFTRALARELGDDGINVNAISPGLTQSDGVKGNPMYPEDYLRAASGSRCFKRIEMPADLTGTALFLASDDSDFITGQTINVDGGGVMH